MAKKTQSPSWIQVAALRVTRVHFVLIAAYMASIVIFDSWNLLAHSAIASRWTLAGGLLAINTVLWYMARMKFSNNTVYESLVLGLVLADIGFASMNVYWERGLASKAVAMFAVPIVVSAVMRSRSTLLAATTLSTAAYSVSVMRYFNLHYGESFRIELYGYMAFYCVMFFVLAALLLIIIRPSTEQI